MEQTGISKNNKIENESMRHKMYAIVTFLEECY